MKASLRFVIDPLLCFLIFHAASVCPDKGSGHGIRKSWCHVPDCPKRAAYKDAEDSRRSCALHRNATDSPISQSCGRLGCRKQASFGPKKGSVLFCEAHKEPEHQNLRSRRCLAANCNKTPSFARKGSLRPQFCALHRQSDHENVVSPLCSFDGCHRQPRFGPSGGGPRHCFVHKKDGFVDLKSKRCTYAEGCSRPAIYGEPKERMPLFCILHKASKHVNCKVRLCEYAEGCGRQPSYGNTLDVLPRFCKLHRRPDDVDLKHPCCRYLGCTKQPRYAASLCVVHERLVKTVRPPLQPTLVSGSGRRRRRLPDTGEEAKA